MAIKLYYDEACSVCSRFAFWMKGQPSLLQYPGRLKWVPMRATLADEAKQKDFLEKKGMPPLNPQQALMALPARLPNGQIYYGFDALMWVVWGRWWLWPFVPLGLFLQFTRLGAIFYHRFAIKRKLLACNTSDLACQGEEGGIKGGIKDDTHAQQKHVAPLRHLCRND